jgi:hypothetical protein
MNGNGLNARDPLTLNGFESEQDNIDRRTAKLLTPVYAQIAVSIKNTSAIAIGHTDVPTSNAREK